MSRDKLRVLDCTIRDGGLVNNWDFSIDFVRDMYRSLSAAGVDYMEIGYKNSPKLLDEPGAGPWRFLGDQFLREVIPQKTRTKLSAVVDIGRVDEEDILPRSDSIIDLIRVCCYSKDVDKAIDLVQKFHAYGYETSINIMAISQIEENELTEALDKISRCPVNIVYIVDSYGSLDNTDIEYLVKKFQSHLPDKELGIHTHNNMQLAFANTLVGSQQGVTFLDSSVYGMGRAAGNCPTELLLSNFKNDRYTIGPVLDIIERLFIPLRDKVEWGYIIPYTITGILNEHPRAAMVMRNSEDKDKFLDLYNKLTFSETQLPLVKSKR
jgi:4-hydroxy 2-oxovalerate aldolase